MTPKGFQSLVELLKDPFGRVPSLRFAHGAVGYRRGRRITASVEYRAPEGYRILDATVEPVDPRAAKTVTPRLLSNDGRTANGQVKYFGRDRTWLRNCEGGGHGSVRIKGEIVREESSLGLLISLLLALALIVGVITLFGSIPPPDSGSRTRKMQSALPARLG
jgi:hypothetical protein